MPAQLPDSLQLVSPDGTKLPSGGGAPPTDFGLGEAASALGPSIALAQTNRRLQAHIDAEKADYDVAPAVQKLQEDASDAYAKAYAARDPTKPGFGVEQSQAMRDMAIQRQADLKSVMTPGQFSAFQRASGELAGRLGQHAVDTEAQGFVALADQQRQTTANDLKANNFVPGYAADKTAVINGFKIDQPPGSMAAAGGAAYDKRAADTVAAAPAYLQGQLAGEFAANRPAEMAEFQQKELGVRVGMNNAQVAQQAETLINTLSSNPSSWKMVDQGIQALQGTLQGGDQVTNSKVIDGLRVEGVRSYGEGMRVAGQADQYLAELQSGKFDDILTDKEQKRSLVAEADAWSKSSGMGAIVAAQAQADMQARMDAEVQSWRMNGKGTGLSDADVVAAVGPNGISAADAAKYVTQKRQAAEEYSIVGDIHHRPHGDLQAMAGAAPPNPLDADGKPDPNYNDKAAVWKYQVDAANAEMKQRDSPAAAAMGLGGKPGAANATVGGGTGTEQQQALIQGLYQRALAGDAKAGQQYAQMTAEQQVVTWGHPAGAVQMATDDDVKAMAASVTAAPPEGLNAALTNLSRAARAIGPETIQTSDGTVLHPQEIYLNQLIKAGLSPAEASAVGLDPARMGRFVAAINQQKVVSAQLSATDAKYLKTQVQAATKPFLDSIGPLQIPGSLAQGYVQRTELLARFYRVTQGMDPTAAAEAAAKDLGDMEYAYVAGVRMPKTVADPMSVQWWGPNGTAINSGAGLASTGMALAQKAIMKNGGAALPDLMTMVGGTPALRRQNLANAIASTGRWVTDADDQHVSLYVSNRGQYTPVLDRFGRPIKATFAEFQSLAKGEASRPAFLQPAPPNTPHGPDGHPVSSLSRTDNVSELGMAIETVGEHGHVGDVGPADPRTGEKSYGVRQMQVPTANRYSMQIFGRPATAAELNNNPAYARRVSDAHLAELVQNYGGGAMGALLATAAYNNSPDHVRQWMAANGDPRQGKISWQDWAARIPNATTRAYVQRTYPAYLARVAKRGPGG